MPAVTVVRCRPSAWLCDWLYPRRRRFWLLLLVGATIFAAVSVLAATSGAPPLLYAAIGIGAFVGPLVYVAYVAEFDVLANKPVTLAGSFALAAALGLPAAVLLESVTPAGVGELGPALLVGAIEEPAKVLGVLWLMRRATARFQMDGVVYGAAAGMGFAAFESLLYGLARLESVGALLATLWLRTLLSPFGHGTWTAIICATIWRQKGSGAAQLDLRVALAFATSITLHGFWDWQPLPGILNLFWLLGVGALGLLVLRTIIQRATSEEVAAVLALNPEVAEAQADEPRAVCRRCDQVAPPAAHYCVRCGAALRTAT